MRKTEKSALKGWKPRKPDFPAGWKPGLTSATTKSIVGRLNLTGLLLRWAMMVCEAFVAAVKHKREAESIRTRLSALMALCVESESGSPLRVNNRLVLATAHQPSSKPGHENVPVLVECLGGSFRFSEADAKAQGIPVGMPRILDAREVLELKLLVLVSEWAEREGYLERGWSSDPDLHIQLGLRAGPRRKAKEGSGKLEDLVQYRVDRTSDEKRILWLHKMEEERSERYIEVPMFSAKVVEGSYMGKTVFGKTRSFGILESEVVRAFEPDEFTGTERRSTGRDDQDGDRESHYGAIHEHEGYCGVKPRRKPTKNENALAVRDRYRIDDSEIFICRLTDGYERLQRPVISKKGKPFKVDWKLRSSFVPQGQDKAIKFWEKRFFPENLIALDRFAVSEQGLPYAEHISDDAEVARIMSNPEVRGDYKLSWKRGGWDPFSDRTLPHDDVALLGNEAIAMIRGAIEERAFDHIALVPTPLHGMRTVKSRCFRCEAKWGIKETRTWVRKSHAWVCPVCESERARVMGRVWVNVDLLGMLPIKERLTLVTHVEVAVYGRWLGELIEKGLPVSGVPFSARKCLMLV